MVLMSHVVLLTYHSLSLLLNPALCLANVFECISRIVHLQALRGICMLFLHEKLRIVSSPLISYSEATQTIGKRVPWRSHALWTRWPSPRCAVCLNLCATDVLSKFVTGSFPSYEWILCLNRLNNRVQLGSNQSKSSDDNHLSGAVRGRFWESDVVPGCWAGEFPSSFRNARYTVCFVVSLSYSIFVARLRVTKGRPTRGNLIIHTNSAWPMIQLACAVLIWFSAPIYSCCRRSALDSTHSPISRVPRSSSFLVLWAPSHISTHCIPSPSFRLLPVPIRHIASGEVRDFSVHIQLSGHISRIRYDSAVVPEVWLCKVELFLYFLDSCYLLCMVKQLWDAFYENHWFFQYFHRCEDWWHVNARICGSHAVFNLKEYTRQHLFVL